MKILTTDLQGPALDWAVERALGLPIPLDVKRAIEILIHKHSRGETCSTSWERCGELIERGRLVLSPDPVFGWLARGFTSTIESYGATPIVAVCRRFVALNCGNDVDLPEELVK